jgi:histidinol phosphatase-like enzyme
MQFLVKKINLLAIYVCQHHWNEECLCRKPKPGLIRSAIEDFGLHNQPLLFIGDQEKDYKAAEEIGIEGEVVNENLCDVGNFGLISKARFRIEKIYGVLLNY